MSFWAGRRVAVPGGSGFVGSHLVEVLVQEGARVTVSSRRKSPRFLTEVQSDLRLLTGDLGDADFCKEVVAGQEIVMHLAATVGGIQYNRVHHASLFHRNLLPFLGVLEAARRAGVDRFLVTSSACVYPRHARVPTPEEDGVRGEPEPSNGGYGWAKRMQEYLGGAAMKEFGFPVAIARPYNAYGPRDDFSPATSHVIPALIHKVLSGQNPLEIWGSGHQTRTFLYVKDFVQGLMLCTERYAEGDPVNIGTDQETSIHDLLKMILEITGRKPEIRFDTTQPEGQPRRACDTSKMRRVLGWEPGTDLREGLVDTVRWYEEHGPKMG